MDFENLFRNTSDNYNEVKGQTSSPNKLSSRTSSMSSTVSSVIYYKRMEINNYLKGNIKIEPINCTQLLYATPKRQVNQVSMVADPNSNIIDQYVPIEGPVLNSSSISSPPHINNDNVINI